MKWYERLVSPLLVWIALFGLQTQFMSVRASSDQDLISELLEPSGNVVRSEQLQVSAAVPAPVIGLAPAPASGLASAAVPAPATGLAPAAAPGSVTATGLAPAPYLLLHKPGLQNLPPSQDTSAQSQLALDLLEPEAPAATPASAAAAAGPQTFGPTPASSGLTPGAFPAPVSQPSTFTAPDFSAVLPVGQPPVVQPSVPVVPASWQAPQVGYPISTQVQAAHSTGCTISGNTGCAGTTRGCACQSCSAYNYNSWIFTSNTNSVLLAPTITSAPTPTLTPTHSNACYYTCSNTHHKLLLQRHPFLSSAISISGSGILGLDIGRRDTVRNSGVIECKCGCSCK